MSLACSNGERVGQICWPRKLPRLIRTPGRNHSLEEGYDVPCPHVCETTRTTHLHRVISIHCRWRQARKIIIGPCVYENVAISHPLILQWKLIRCCRRRGHDSETC